MIWPPHDDELHGTIVSMRPLAEADREKLRFAGDDVAIWEWIDRRIPSEPAAFDEWFDARLSKRETGLEWGLVTLATQTGEVIGSSSFLNPRPEHDGVEIGNTWLKPSSWRTGANVEAKLLMLTYAFELLGCMRVEFKTDSRNTRSRGALEALPSTFEGIFRKHMKMPITGVRDSAYYSLTDEEWHASKLQLEVRLEHFTGVPMDTEVERA
ncbi:hypothetical protein BH10ACT11_BH10ACT11_14530 [soil metagenome]